MYKKSVMYVQSYWALNFLVAVAVAVAVVVS